MPLSLDNIFKDETPEKILKKHLYDYRDRANDGEFHFLIGVSMLQLGFLSEAFLAFSKARTIQGDATLKSQLFLCITLMNAERYEQCREELKRIEWTRLDSGQLYVFIDIAERIGIDPINFISYFETKYAHSENMRDKVVYAIRAVKHKPGAAKLRIESMMPEMFAEFDDYFTFLDECHTAGFPSRDIIGRLAIVPMHKKNMKQLIKTMVSTRSFLEMTKKERDDWGARALRCLPESERDLRSRVWSALYEAEEYYDNETRMKDDMAELLKLYDAGAREETSMMAIAAYFLKHFSNENVGKAQEILSALVGRDPENMLFRKYLHELMLKTGRFEEAEKVNIASIEIRAQKEREINDLLIAFHRYYGSRKCPLEVEDHVCPLCFGSEELPQFKVVCANVSPREIYTKKMVSHTISIKDEATMAKIFDWQPTHVASPIVGEYLKSLGTYPSKRGFPDVLVEGETYVFIRYRREALQRLIDEGFSLNQIDPMFSVLYPSGKPKELAAASETDNPVDLKGVVSANDFVIEIVKAVSPDIPG